MPNAQMSIECICLVPQCDYQSLTRTEMKHHLWYFHGIMKRVRENYRVKNEEAVKEGWMERLSNYLNKENLTEAGRQLAENINK